MCEICDAELRQLLADAGTGPLHIADFRLGLGRGHLANSYFDPEERGRRACAVYSTQQVAPTVDRQKALAQGVQAMHVNEGIDGGQARRIREAEFGLAKP
jgi:hypothetical protein